MAEINPIAGFEAVKAAGITTGIPESILTTPAAVQPATIARVDFGELLNAAIGAINNSQVSSDAAVAKLAAGQNVELHNVMIAAEKAALTLELAMQIKNKISEAYQEIMRMQV